MRVGTSVYLYFQEHLYGGVVVEDHGQTSTVNTRTVYNPHDRIMQKCPPRDVGPLPDDALRETCPLPLERE